MSEKEIVSFEEKTIETLRHEFAMAEGMKSITKKARFYAALDSISKFIEDEMKMFKASLLEAKVEEYFEDENLKVVYQEGKVKTEINILNLYNDLKKNNREFDFVRVASVSEKAIKDNLSDADLLIATHKRTLQEKTTPTISVKALSADDKKRLEEKRIKGE